MRTRCLFLTRRFGVLQKDKVRPIDDYKASLVNSAVTQVDMVTLHGVDRIACLGSAISSKEAGPKERSLGCWQNVGTLAGAFVRRCVRKSLDLQSRDPATWGLPAGSVTIWVDSFCNTFSHMGHGNLANWKRSTEVDLDIVLRWLFESDSRVHWQTYRFVYFYLLASFWM